MRRLNLVERLLRRRAVFQAAIDASCWTIALGLATVLRYDFRLDLINVVGVAIMIPLAVELQYLSGHVFGLYRGRWRYGSFDEVASLVKAASLTTMLVFLADLLLARERSVPLGSALAAGPTALILMAGVRYASRLRLERRRRPTGADGTRLLVFGAGEGGVQVITAMLRDPESPYFPVGLLDDDQEKRNLRIMGVPVVGDRRNLVEAADRYRADALLVAIPSAGAPLLSELNDVAAEANLPVKVLPPVKDLFGGGVGIADIRDIGAKDLLGRHQVETDVASIAGYLTAKRVLVTGAGGSIGSELCRQIIKYAPADLVMLDSSEAGLHAVQLSLDGRADLDSESLVLGDIRDQDMLRRLFESRRPEVVFHAAALKHLPILERAPGEAVKTNVWGTLAVLDAAVDSGVERFVNISTDKAAEPISVLGFSKRITERVTAYFGRHTGRPFLSVRFGNVLASSGSVVTTFHAQLKAGGPLTVTHPDVTRYFMTVDEACELVVQAGAIGRPGEVLVLDMGQPVRIAEVAERLASQGPRPVRIVHTGLRVGEKLHEVLLADGEVDERPIHPLISHLEAPALDPLDARSLDPWDQPDRVVDALAKLARRTSAMESARPQ